MASGFTPIGAVPLTYTQHNGLNSLVENARTISIYSQIPLLFDSFATLTTKLSSPASLITWTGTNVASNRSTGGPNPTEDDIALPNPCIRNHFEFVFK